jgi:hypothetical protein
MKNNTKIVSENKSSKNKIIKKTPEKVKLKVYLMAIRRSMKEYWSFDKWNMISQFLAQTVLVVGSFASVYVAVESRPRPVFFHSFLFLNIKPKY